MTVRMTARVFHAIALGVAVCSTVLPQIVRGEDAPAGIENSKYQAEGTVNSNAVYIRSGPSENDYPTIKLDRGATVTVVGVKLDWLKILPPDGSYCYVAKAYVEKHGDGTVGKVTNPLNVRVGSSLNAMKTKVATRLDNGDTVKIVGEQDEYFKIAPPKEVFLYVNKQFVDLVRNVNVTDATPKTGTDATTPPAIAPAPTPAPGGLTAAATPTTPTTPDATQTPPPTQTADATTPPPIAPAPVPDNSTSIAPPPRIAPIIEGPTAQIPPPIPTSIAEGASTTQPSQSPSVAAAATSQPSDVQADAENKFDALERAYIENDKKTIDQQSPANLLSGYQKLLAGSALPESLRRMCDYRVSSLKQRAEDQQRYLAVQKSQNEMKQKSLALQAEREELETRIKATGVKYFTAVGTLRPSSLQQGGGTLYRLTDPQTGRTVIYIRSDDPKIGSLAGQFIGVQGVAQQDQVLNLKAIVPTAFEIVDESKVNVTVAAQIVPPSLMPSGTASVGGE